MKTPAVPMYVMELLKRSRYNYTADHPDYAAGYTLEIEKRTVWAFVETLAKEIRRLEGWVKRNGGTMSIISLPEQTRYCRQYAVVTIFDPLMKALEQHIEADS